MCIDMRWYAYNSVQPTTVFYREQVIHSISNSNMFVHAHAHVDECQGYLQASLVGPGYLMVGPYAIPWLIKHVY